MRSDTLFELTADLRELGGGRVWSLLVSLFGDLAQGPGDKIDGPVLSAIMAELDVRPEAGRVALHRLRNDGWITSEKAGRISQHSLTAKGRAESAAASPRIYARPDDGTDEWHVVILENGDLATKDDLSQAGLIQLLPRVCVGTPQADPPAGALVLTPTQTPGWVYEQIAQGSPEDDYEDLYRALSTLMPDLPQPAQLSPLSVAVLRCLAVHNWRRLVLKHPAIPRGLVPADSLRNLCHRAVEKLLNRYPRPALSDIALEAMRA